MVTALVDTSIVVDLLRGYQPAETWATTQSTLGASRIVWLEVIEGVQNLNAQRIAMELLNSFELIEITTQDAIWATEKLLQLNLSHNIDTFDCLIAAVNHRLQIPLYTRNLKHFTPLIGSLAQAPY
ncbi:MAG: PIN domain-containing protein [Anaerolineae bacterium]|nr:PIN domain-containing protein [Anaerolineae bacterium]